MLNEFALHYLNHAEKVANEAQAGGSLMRSFGRGAGLGAAVAVPSIAAMKYFSRNDPTDVEPAFSGLQTEIQGRMSTLQQQLKSEEENARRAFEEYQRRRHELISEAQHLQREAPARFQNLEDEFYSPVSSSIGTGMKYGLPVAGGAGLANVLRRR